MRFFGRNQACSFEKFEFENRDESILMSLFGKFGLSGF